MRQLTILGIEVQVGDEIEFLGKTYRVTRFDAHPRPTARVAVSEWDDAREERRPQWSITLFDNDRLIVRRA